MDFVVTEAIIEPSLVVVHECIIKTVAQNNTQKLPKLIPYWLVKSLDTNMFNKNICFHGYIFACILFFPVPFGVVCVTPGRIFSLATVHLETAGLVKQMAQ